MDQIKKYLLSQVAKQELSKEEAKIYLTEILREDFLPQRDIAIIGVAGRFSSANNIDDFWKLLQDGKNDIHEFPETRRKDFEHVITNPYYAEFVLGKSIAAKDVKNINIKAGYLSEIDKFDAGFFNISPSEATYMEPNQRVALEVAWEAVEDAGFGGEALKGTKTGVFLGRDTTNYSFYRLCSEQNPMQLTGSWESLIASRISYQLDLKGPSMLIDTACSAGLVSIHTAVQSILLGECDMALAGGLHFTITGDIKPHFLTGANMENVESEDGIVRTFDAGANGTVWGEGIGVVMLKPLAKAVEDGDFIRAVIKASSINNDGATNSLTAPNAITQESVIVDAWKKSNISPESISYVEAHGTGTVLGDPIELKGLTNAFRHFTKRQQFCAIGSLKTQMGHMVGASGAASLIKVVKSMEHKELTPITNFRIPNPYVNFVDAPVYINNVLKPWEPIGGIRRAAVSAFGFSRTNCHMVVEEPPQYAPSAARQPRYCLTISAKNQDVLKEYFKKYMGFLDSSDWSLADICYTSNIGRGHYEYRVAIIAENKERLYRAIRDLYNSESTQSWGAGIYMGYHTIVSDKKKRMEANEISGLKKKELSDRAMYSMKKYIEGEWADRELLESVCRMYVEGADVHWNLFYSGIERLRKVPLPVYPLQKIRFWANPKTTKVRQHMREALHPLVENELFADKESICFQTILEPDRQWVLSDHRINHTSVLPGTSYLEMVRYAFERVSGNEKMEFKDVFFLSPMIIHEESVLIQLTLTKIDKGYMFSVTSKNGEKLVPHVEGKILVLGFDEDSVSIDLENLKTDAKSILDPYIDESDTGVFQFGPHWDNVRSVWELNNGVLAKLQINESFSSELDTYKLHPSMLDNAVNLTSQNTGNTFLPIMYKQIMMYGPFTKEIYSYIQFKAANDETMTYDINLYDNKGNLLVRIIDYTVKKVNHIESIHLSEQIGQCLQLKWVLSEDQKVETDAHTTDRCALITMHGQDSSALEAELRLQSEEVTVFYLDNNDNASDNQSVRVEKEIEKIIKSIKEQSIQCIIFAPYYVAPYTDIVLSKSIKETQALGIGALFTLSQSILKQNMKLSQGIKVLLKDAYRIDGTENIMPFSAAAVALARVVGQEYSHLKVDVIDASKDITVKQVAQECFTVRTASIRALRIAGVYEEELQKRTILPLNQFSPEKNGVYIITGGLGGLGLSVAKWLLDKGEVSLILIGRRPLADTDEWEKLSNNNTKEGEMYRSLLDLKNNSKNLTYLSVDLTVKDDVLEACEDITKCFGKISGIFHAAGVAGDGFLISKSKDQFQEVLAPKIDGSVNLLTMLLQTNKDAFMVMFSSIIALTGSEGQSDYSAANAFLDALADYGQEKGINIISVNWPSWKDVGMSVRFGIKSDDSLLHHISVKEGLKWLETMICSPERRIIPTILNMQIASQMKEDMPFRLSADILNDIDRVHNKKADKGVNSSDLREAKIKGMSNPNYIHQAIANFFATVLDLEEIDAYASFQDMGGSSLMATQLLKLIEGDFPGTTDISDIFSYPSVWDLAEFIGDKLGDPFDEACADQVEVTDKELMEILEQELHGSELITLFSNDEDGGKH